MLGPLGARWLCWSVVLHHKLRFLCWPGYQTAGSSAWRCVRGTSELRREAALVDVARRELLVGRHYQLERHTKPSHQTDRFAPGRHGFIPGQQTPIDKSQL